MQIEARPRGALKSVGGEREREPVESGKYNPPPSPRQSMGFGHADIRKVGGGEREKKCVVVSTV